MTDFDPLWLDSNNPNSSCIDQFVLLPSAFAPFLVEEIEKLSPSQDWYVHGYFKKDTVIPKGVMRKPGRQASKPLDGFKDHYEETPSQSVVFESLLDRFNELFPKEEILQAHRDCAYQEPPARDLVPFLVHVRRTREERVTFGWYEIMLKQGLANDYGKSLAIGIDVKDDECVHPVLLSAVWSKDKFPHDMQLKSPDSQRGSLNSYKKVICIAPDFVLKTYATKDD